MTLLVEIIKVLFDVIYHVLIAAGPFTPIFIYAVIATVLKKNTILLFFVLSVFSSLINIICWLSPSHTSTMAAVNQIISLLSINGILDLIIYSFMSSLGIVADFVTVIVFSFITFLYFRFR